MIFCQDPEITGTKFGYAVDSRVFIVTIGSSWQIREFFNSLISQNIMNLLVASAGSALQEKNQNEIPDIKLYTHQIYIDGLGSSTQKILTTWRKDKFTRPEINLYPVKLVHGFQGHRFILSTIEKPPLVFRSTQVRNFGHEEQSTSWDGIEVRLLRIIAQILNFTLEIHDATIVNTARDEAEDRIIDDLVASKADMGISGLYITNTRNKLVDFSPVVMQDCGTFMSLGSYALSKYRAIFGPFHWSIWVMVLFTYMIAIFPISFTNNRSIKTLCKNPKQLEKMCCYMFGTYTNLFTFRGVKSWTNTKMGSTRLFIGTYWIFTIIITTAYTSSIIAFITLPEQPITVDTSYQLVDEGYKVITLDKGGWQSYFNITNDIISKKLISNVKSMNNLEDAIDYIVKTRFILDYAFLGSKISLSYLSFSNYIQKYKNKKIFLHVASECYVPFSVGVAYKKNFIFRNIFSNYILRVQQSGILTKIIKDVEWEITQRSGLKQSVLNSPEDRQLALDDVQGMFVLLGGGILLAAFTLLIEIIKQKRERRKVAQVKVKKYTKNRSISLTVKENTTNEFFRPSTTY
ncbi:Ionotropic glutamate receptor, L-glutamate and glycine-binding domain,Ionotropic glutamate [Cinara cedri]|uniref:Ionotropic glutamate receptor, L-glutamate and glycine-binding domain,Ionotropic glutamate n=1 Tax=Cinara cedri TaxID=506608 RepID=A0A5E4MKU0_9HEMI|nr:Ionotropic glutamate receptor, L-glutamate and glycine-binding domain,Ionotropic glutamate [Cinara cedri]